MRRKTNEQFKQEVRNLVGDEYTFLDAYVNNYTKLKIKHNKCGSFYEVKPSAFLDGKRCPYCSSNARKTNKQFQQEVRNLIGDEYTFLDTYVDNKTKLRVKHNKCGNTYEVQPNAFFHGSRCPYCKGGVKKSDKWFKQKVMSLVGNEYTFLDAYVNARTKIRVKHNKCGNIYKVRPNDFFCGKRCPHCFGTPKKTDAEFKQQVYDLVGDEYTFLDDYVNSKTKIRVKHDKCGNIYEVTPNEFLSGRRCPYCSNYKSELIINKILKSLNINYEYQKTFDDLKDTRSLSYDFYIPGQNILIEYQGVQHYQPIDYFGGKDKFAIQKKHDRMKVDYAKNNDYNLIAVPYTEDTFIKIKKYLIKHGLTA